MSNTQPKKKQSPRSRSPVHFSAPYRRNSTLSGHNLAKSPVLYHDTERSAFDPFPGSIIGLKRPLSPMRSTASVLVRQSGSPERRKRIRELEAMGMKYTAIATPTLKYSPEPPVSGDPPALIDGFVPDLKKSPKRARFADPEVEVTKDNGDGIPSTVSLEETLERISATLTGTAMSLQNVQETQKTIFGEISQLKLAIKALENRIVNKEKCDCFKV